MTPWTKTVLLLFIGSSFLDSNKLWTMKMLFNVTDQRRIILLNNIVSKRRLSKIHLRWEMWRRIHGNIQLLHSRHMLAIITLSGPRASELIFGSEHWGYESISLNRSYCLIVRATSWIPPFVKIYWVSFICDENMRSSTGSYFWLGPKRSAIGDSYIQ